MGKPRSNIIHPELPAQFLAAYERNDCQKGKTCTEVGISSSVVSEWESTLPEFKRKMSELEQAVNEKVEKNLLEMALDGKNIVASIFYLKNNWRNKYGDRQEMEVVPSQLWFQPKKEIESDQKLLQGENESRGNIQP